jgi:hypothetical protein
MEFVITPFESVGVIKFGMSQAAVRQVLNSMPKKYSTGYVDPYLDHFSELDIRVGYNRAKLCQEVDLFPDAQPIFRGRNLFRESIGELKEWFESIDSLVEIDNTGVMANRFGIFLYTTDYYLDNKEFPESVSVYEKDYGKKSE